ncbi:MD-2-related lipid-recognition domain-containing protein [Gorgonomyces haynaldii]|nr:MD-2-related lipid-recognition domain-containing protein [Gorgonomyces haynaldii]
MRLTQIQNCIQNPSVELTNLQLSPNPPVSGQELTVTGLLSVKQPIQQGAIGHVQVQMNTFPIANVDLDICQLVECPFVGEQQFKKPVQVPAKAPRGEYRVQVTIEQSEQKLGCVSSQVSLD